MAWCKSDLVHPAVGMPGELSCEKEITLGRGVKLAAKIEVTAKGNGTLTIGKLKVAVFDDHNDGAFYEDEMLKTDFVDIDGDGFLDLVLSGIICFTDEKGDKVVGREAFVCIYKYCGKQRFRKIYSSSDFDLEVR